MKALIEKKNSLIEELEGILTTAKSEVRAFTEEEDVKVEEIKKEIRGLEKLIADEEEVRSFDKKEIKVEKEEEEMTKEEIRSLEVEKEERAFIEAIKTGEFRNFTAGQNGTIIPVTIASDVIDTVKDMCPLLEHADIYHVAGELRLPKFKPTSGAAGGATTPMAAAYVTEFQDVTEYTAQFETVSLGNVIVGTLTKISKSLINRAGFDVRGFIVNKVAKTIAEFLEKEMLVGNGGLGAIQGAIKTNTTVTAAAPDAIKTEELVDLQMALPTQYQPNAIWVMNKNVLKALRKLKDANNNFLLQPDLRQGFGYTLLGRPVYLSDNMNGALARGNEVILYMDPSGYSVKMTKSMEIQMLMEKYASQYAIGVCAFCELDGKITDESKIAKLKMHA